MVSNQERLNPCTHKNNQHLHEEGHNEGDIEAIQDDQSEQEEKCDAHPNVCGTLELFRIFQATALAPSVL